MQERLILEGFDVVSNAVECCVAHRRELTERQIQSLQEGNDESDRESQKRREDKDPGISAQRFFHNYLLLRKNGQTHSLPVQ